MENQKVDVQNCVSGSIILGGDEQLCHQWAEIGRETKMSLAQFCKDTWWFNCQLHSTINPWIWQSQATIKLQLCSKFINKIMFFTNLKKSRNSTSTLLLKNNNFLYKLSKKILIYKKTKKVAQFYFVIWFDLHFIFTRNTSIFDP